MPEENKNEDQAAQEAAAAAAAAAPADKTEGDSKLFDQAEVNRLIGDVRRDYRGRLDALEAREHALNLKSLAADKGVDQALLEKTGLKGEALEAFATDLAATLSAAKGSAPSAEEQEQKNQITLGDALGAAGPTGIQPESTQRYTPISLEDALSNITLEEIR